MTLNNPFMLGFENIERMMADLAKAGAEGFPPYNIQQMAPNEMRITLAVAGFGEDDLDIGLENNQLVIKGSQCPCEDEDKPFIHRGIAARNFQRSFVLAQGMEVKKAHLDRGLLNIDLIRPEPEVKITKIKINAPSPSAKALTKKESHD